MTKRIFTLLALLLWASTTLAQTSREEVMADIDRAGGVYYGYPTPSSAVYTPAPKGYEPFYISHYGRHGSRYMI